MADFWWLNMEIDHVTVNKGFLQDFSQNIFLIKSLIKLI